MRNGKKLRQQGYTVGKVGGENFVLINNTYTDQLLISTIVVLLISGSSKDLSKDESNKDEDEATSFVVLFIIIPTVESIDLVQNVKP